MQENNIVRKPAGVLVFPHEYYESHFKLWDTDMDAAQKILGQADKNNLWVLGSLAEVALWKFMLQESDEHKAALETALAEFEKLANINYTKYDPSVAWYDFFSSAPSAAELQLKHSLFLASVVSYATYYMALTFFTFRIGERVSGAYYFRKSWKYFEQAKDLIIEQKKLNLVISPEVGAMVNFGVGVFHLLMSILPPHLQTISTLIGFEASRESAIHELEQCSQSGTPKAAEATLLIIMLKKFLIVGKDVEADKMLENFQQCYPNSIVTSYTSGFMCRLIGDLAKAEDYFHKTLEFGVKLGSPQMKATGAYHLGYCAYLQNDWKRSEKYFQDFLDAPVAETQKRFRPYSAYICGFSMWMNAKESGLQPDVQKIVDLYTKAQDWIRSHESYDVFAKRKTNEFMQNRNFPIIEEHAIRAGALVEGKQFKAAMLVLEDMKKLDLASTVDFEAIYYFLLASCHKGLREWDTAEKLFNQCISYEGKLKLETYTIPYSWVLLGEIAIETDRLDEASRCFTKVSSYSGYDWERLLNFRIFSDKQKLEDAKERK